MGKKSQRPSVQISTYDQAATILNKYEESRSHLQFLIEKFIPNGKLIINSADLDYLEHCGRTIKGVAERFFREHSDLLTKIKSLSSIKEETKRELTEERICIQLEGQKIHEGYRAYLTKQYNNIKNQQPY